MALPEEPTWHASIYQIEPSDPVQGGAPNLTPGQEAGRSNWAAKQLADRTAWLKEQVDTHAAALDPDMSIDGGVLPEPPPDP